MNVPAKIESNADELAEALLIKGDYSNLTIQERAKALVAICRSLGLNPLTRPIEFINMQGKLVPYAKRDAADQLRKLNGISLAIVSREEIDGMLVVHVRAVDKHGREDEDFGAVPMNDSIKGEARSNALLKCVTKAKRRVTLSISGLGFLDETEVEDVQRATIRRPSAKPNPMLPPHNPVTGEVDDYADQMDHALGNGNGNATTETKEDAAKEDQSEYENINEKVALCGSVKALGNYFRTLCDDDQELFRDVFTKRKAELEGTEK